MGHNKNTILVCVIKQDVGSYLIKFLYYTIVIAYLSIFVKLTLRIRNLKENQSDTAHQSFAPLRDRRCSLFLVFDRPPYLAHGNSARACVVSQRRWEMRTRARKKKDSFSRGLRAMRSRPIGLELIAVTPVPPSRRERALRTELRTCVGKCAESSVDTIKRERRGEERERFSIDSNFSERDLCEN